MFGCRFNPLNVNKPTDTRNHRPVVHECQEDDRYASVAATTQELCSDYAQPAYSCELPPHVLASVVPGNTPHSQHSYISQHVSPWFELVLYQSELQTLYSAEYDLNKNN